MVLEVIALVSGIISAFVKSAGFVERLQQRWNDRRKENPREKLKDPENDVGQEYKFDHRRLAHVLRLVTVSTTGIPTLLYALTALMQTSDLLSFSNS